MAKQVCDFFLGANTPKGFVSLFPSLCAEDPRLFISAIKSGPGCGKSTFLAQILDWEGEDRTERFFCSSDPDSLDGVLRHGRHLAVLDGTAPHVYDPDFPGVQGAYIGFPPFLQPEALRAKRTQLESLSHRSKALYTQAYRMLSAVQLLEQRIQEQLLPLVSPQRLLRRAAGIAGRELHRQTGSAPGIQRFRFLDGVTPKGPIFLRSTVEAMASRIYLLEDRCGLAGGMLELLRDRALAQGWEVYTCLSPRDPARILHLILPGLNLAFVTEDGTRMGEASVYRRIRINAYVPPESLRPLRGKLRLLTQIRDSLMEDVVRELAAAHSLHDEIEALYRPHLDIPALCQLSEAFRLEHQG